MSPPSMPADEITDLAEERRKRGKDNSESMYVCPECGGAVWFCLVEGDVVCVTCGLVPEDIQVVKN